ncbi:hypothetical protein LINPERHAP2_LOCUS16076 [Linum perenne]
MSAIGSHIRY